MAADLDHLSLLVDQDTILVTHGPPRGILDLNFRGESVGSLALAGFIQSHSFHAHIHGHIHESYGQAGRHFNVASATSKYATIIDLDLLTATACRL